MPAEKKSTGGNRARGTRSGVYSQTRKNGALVWYGDFRPFEDVGGKCERLVDPATGANVATRVEAQALYATRCAQWQKIRDARANNALTHFGPMIKYHLIKRA